MKKLMYAIGINDAVNAGMDPAKLGLVPVTLHRYDGAIMTFIPAGEKVYATAARTCLVVNGIACVGVTTDAEIKICEGKRPSLGQASKVLTTTVVFDRKESRLSFTDSLESAVEKARKACSATSKIAAELRRIKEIRAKHPRILKKEQDRMRAEVLKRSEDRKAGRLRAREIADCRFATRMYHTCVAHKMGLGLTPWDTENYRYHREQAIKDGPAMMMAGAAVSPGLMHPERFTAHGRRVVSEFYSGILGRWVIARSLKMATEHGAKHLVEVLDSFRKEVSK